MQESALSASSRSDSRPPLAPLVHLLLYSSQGQDALYLFDSQLRTRNTPTIQLTASTFVGLELRCVHREPMGQNRTKRLGVRHGIEKNCFRFTSTNAPPRNRTPRQE
ncbi:hypothetical protein B0H12DRAFT_546213 [Mycena haematopus]|nr:hypothetical protein B0H12DRAFT_546213 [Mycena haematopus]